MQQKSVLLLVAVIIMGIGVVSAQVDTGQEYCYDADGGSVTCPAAGEAFFGQDGNYRSAAPAYVDNGDGTVTDLNTGLMWIQDAGEKVSFEQAFINAENSTIGGYNDWRMPTITELYSLIDFTGITPNPIVDSEVPYLPDVFAFQFGDESVERAIDSQYWSATEYVSTTMNGAATVFGVNFADGRIKGYPRRATQYALFVRGTSTYDQNNYVNNGDGTVTDTVSGLTWMQGDSGVGMDWEQALAYCEAAVIAGHDDWRLPNAKELQALVDYSRSPDTTNSPAIDPVFSTTQITNEVGQADFPYFWTSTTHLDGANLGDFAVYVSFGRALGYMNGQFLDVHGAGAQRSDPKIGVTPDPTSSNAPQGDIIRITNYVRCVRGGDVQIVTGGEVDPRITGSSSQPAQPPQEGQGNQLPTQPPQGGQGQQSIPQPAIDACAGQSAGAACSFQSPNGTISGTCGSTPENQLVCTPQ